jgi:hypothetical protein
MRLRYACVAFYVILALAACAKPEKLIIGKWQMLEGLDSIEFLQDGTFTINGLTGLGGKAGNGTFKFMDDAHLKLEGDFAMEISIAFSGEELTIKTSDGQALKYRKLRY